MGLRNLTLDLSHPEGMRAMETIQATRLEIEPDKFVEES